jgi:hypothetical protein
VRRLGGLLAFSFIYFYLPFLANIWELQLKINSEFSGNLPVAPASNNASACTNPNPLAAPLTNTTLSTKLNSGSLFVVPRYVGTFELSCERAELSALGGAGGSRVVAEAKGLSAEKLRVTVEIGFGVARTRRKGMRRMEFMLELIAFG